MGSVDDDEIRQLRQEVAGALLPQSVKQLIYRLLDVIAAQSNKIETQAARIDRLESRGSQ